MVPDKFKPSLVGNILIRRVFDGIPYIDIVEAENTLNLELLDWVLSQYRDGVFDSVRFFLNGYPNWVTRDTEFDKAMRRFHKSITIKPIK
jgi:hypothetical protein